MQLDKKSNSPRPSVPGHMRPPSLDPSMNGRTGYEPLVSTASELYHTAQAVASQGAEARWLEWLSLRDCAIYRRVLPRWAAFPLAT